MYYGFKKTVYFCMLSWIVLILHNFKHVSFKGDDLLNAVDAIKSDIQDINVYVQGKQQTDLPTGYVSMDDLMLKSHPIPVVRSIREGVTMDGPLCYIFTSGTTGKS